MITPQFKQDESNLSIVKGRFCTLINKIIPLDLRPKIFTAYGLARFCHFNHSRDEGTPYILHPLRVSLYLIENIKLSEGFLKKQNVSKEDALIVTLFHDTLEDYGEKIIPLLEEEFGANVLGMIQLLSKNMSSSIEEYYNQLKKAPEIIRIIKVLDRLDNLRGLLKSEIKSSIKKKDYLLESKSKILTLIDPDYSSECGKLIDIFSSVISYLEESLCKAE